MIRTLVASRELAVWNSTHDRFLAGLVLDTMCLSWCGCSDSGPRRVPVSGTVTVDGALLEKGTIQFAPVDNSGPMVAVTVNSGNFQAPADAGPIAGECKVNILVQKDLGFSLDDDLAYARAAKQSKRPLSPMSSRPPVFVDQSQQIVRLDAARDDLNLELVTPGRRKSR